MPYERVLSLFVFGYAVERQGIQQGRACKGSGVHDVTEGMWLAF